MKILGFFLCLFCFIYGVNGQVKSISPDEASALLKNKRIVFLDVRTKSEVIEGRIPKSIHIDYLQEALFLKKIKRRNKDKTYIIYCRTGKRSIAAAEIMNQQGFVNVWNMPGGITEWKGPISSRKRKKK